MSVDLTADISIAALLDNMPDAVLIVNRDGRIVLANTKAIELFGYTKTELLDMQVEVLIPQRYRERHVYHRDAYSVAPHPRAMGGNYLELYGLRRSGAEFPVAIQLAPFGEDRTVAAIRDMSLAERAATARQMRIFPRSLVAWAGFLLGAVVGGMSGAVAGSGVAVWWLRRETRHAAAE